MLTLNKKGFTLIELLVVIAIIGILSSVVLVSLNSARQKANAAKATGDASQVMTAIEMSAADGCANVQNMLVNTNLVLCGNQYMAKVPVAPSGYNYSFAGQNVTPGSSYTLIVNGFTDGGIFNCNSGSCACQNAGGCIK